MTAHRLAAAGSTVLGYNAVVRGNKGILMKLNRFEWFSIFNNFVLKHSQYVRYRTITCLQSI